MILNLNDKRESVKLNIQDIKGGKIGKLIKFYFIFLINLSYFDFCLRARVCWPLLCLYRSFYYFEVCRTQRADEANSCATHLLIGLSLFLWLLHMYIRTFV
jgi:hypothetical protein